ncbi:MAG: efflux RND transporter periplasmic adaptor subunit [Xanthomonadaceae bacterium]|nr:efflux RND transporter periplasmic adaptor subunit [Xanthomonadaceae bacterium]
MKKIVSAIVIIAVLLAMGALVAKRKGQAKEVKAYGSRPVPVHAAPVKQQPLKSTHSYLGILEARQTARVSSRISAKVDKVLFDEGAQVDAGEPLIELDDQDIQADIKGIEAQIMATRTTIQSLKTNKAFWVAEDKRDRKLAQEEVISKVEAETTNNRMTEAVAKLQAAQGSLETLQQNRNSLSTKLMYSKLRSPFAGQVTTRHVDPGDLATPGKTLMVVEERNDLKIGFDTPQEDMHFLKVGLPVQAEIAGKKLNLTISHIYPSFDRSRMVRVEVKTPTDPNFKIGSFVPLTVIWQEHPDALTIPQESLIQNGAGDWVVFVVVDGKLKQQPVKKVMESANRVEITGLKLNDKVVVSTFLGWANLASDLKVEVIK